jgi:hypothetical protein
MSLYATQKFLFHLNRDASVQTRWRDEMQRAALLDTYALSTDERQAIEDGNVGLLYVLGCNGQLLMHFAPLLGLAWPQYLEALREGVRQHGPVRAGIYAMTTSATDKVAGV